MDSVLWFARSLTPVKGRIQLIKTNPGPEYIDEVERQIRVLVTDSARKMEATKDRLPEEWAEDPIDAKLCEVQSKGSPPFTLCDSTTSTHSLSSGPIRLGLSILPKADQDPHYSINRRNKSPVCLFALPLV